MAAKAKCLFLPEASDYIASSPDEGLTIVKSVKESPFVLGLQQEAKNEKLSIVAGIHEPATLGKVKNTCIYIDEFGDIKQRYVSLYIKTILYDGWS